MEAVAKTKSVRISPRKVRLVADAIRELSVDRALQLLITNQKHGASVLLKTLQSAVANALVKGTTDQSKLYIARLEVDGGPTLRRMHIGSRSHVRMYTKRSTHVTLVVSDIAKPIAKKQMKKAITKTKEKKGEKEVKGQKS